MISMLEFLKDTLANVGLLEALLEWDPNNVTQIKIKKLLNVIRIKFKKN